MLLVLGVFLFFLFFGMPVAFAIGISGLVFFLTTPDVPLSIAVQRTLTTSQSFTMLAIPLFIFAGHLMNSTGITKRLITLANVLTGHMYGNLAQVSVVLSTLMGGVSGSAVADAAMQSRILGPDMVKRGYKPAYGAAINGVSSLITATIPPSMGLIIYGSIGEVSIGRLFAAGIVPGIMMMIILMIAVSYTSRKNNYLPERKKPPGIKEVLLAVKDGIWALIFPIILIVGIRYGIFTPSESGAFAAVYAIFIGVVVYKELTWKTFLETVQESAIDIGAIMLIISVSGVFGYGIVYDNVTSGLSAIITGITDNQYMLFGIIILTLIIAGMFVETTVITLLLTPIFVPIVTSVGIDPVHFGLVMMTVTTFGIITPPMGVSLFTVSQIMGCSPQDTVKEAIPFYFATMLVVAIMVFFPDLILFVPDMVFGE
ncbi:tripartite ATP-independent transporter DctM subunit [Neobacillus niacini]|uniref:TRAP transporter large permease n=1 Tax=Neobacillus niacini TaxID=86668 RepID=UPI002789F855|nr:TRAP transporter large permease [Neobacillus niacini]MDQ1004539.1 tripartite ATP-independent transporter DctM subunit [Neobacillus niacini]